MIGTIIKLAVLYELGLTVRGTIERHNYYNEARYYCDQVGKPLLRIGMRRLPWEPPNGDVTIDIDPEVLNLEGGVLGDERQMPFVDKQFGVAFNEHTLEHLYSPEDVEQAVNECVRVADKAVFLVPSPYSIAGNLLNPTHHLRLWFDQLNNRILVEENKYNIGLGFNFGSTFDYKNISPAGIGQVLVAENISPKIITSGHGFIVV